jgi:hypothetical protein
MSLKYYLLAIAITTFSAGVIWFWVLFNIDPGAATQFELVVFYSSMSIFLMGLFTLVSFYFRLLKSRNEYYYGNLLVSLRQGLFISSFALIVLVLKSMRIINTIEILLLFAAFSLFEMYFLAKQ